MQYTRLILLASGVAALLAACGKQGVTQEPAERTGYYEFVDGKSINEQALQWAYAGHVTEMKKLLSQDSELANVVVDDMTPLMAAVMNESSDMVNFLLEQGADPNLSTTFGSPLSIAYETEADRRIVNALKAHGAH